MRQLQSILIAALVLPTLLVLGAGPALADGLMSMSDPAVGTTGPQSAEGPLTLTCPACSPALSITGVASGESAIAVPSGTLLCFDGTGCTKTLSFTGGQFLFSSAVATTSSASIAGGLYNGSSSNGGSLAFSDATRWLSTANALLESSSDEGTPAVTPRTAFVTQAIKALTLVGSKMQSWLNGAVEVASIGYDGAATFAGRVSGAGVQAVSGAEPACDATARGLIWTVAGGAGVADTVRVCAKDAADAFAWRTIY